MSAAAGRGRGRGRTLDHADSVSASGIADSNINGGGPLLGGLLTNARDTNTTLSSSAFILPPSSSSSNITSPSVTAPASSGRGMSHHRAGAAASARSDRTPSTTPASLSSSKAALPAPASLSGIDEYAALIAARISDANGNNDGGEGDGIGAIDQAAFARTRNLMADNAAGTQTCLVCQETVR